MRTIATCKTVNHNWAEMFALVVDVERYPQFVPGCTNDHVYSRREVGPGRTEIISRMTVGLPPIQFGYTNRTLADRQARRVTVEATDGPLRRLHVTWQFDPLGPTQTQVTFSADYEFRNPVIAHLAAGAFESLFRKIVDAFEKRARIVPVAA
jgi:coenzyme Q-binding protein COQ10